jgi:hypothetical protein
VAATAIADRVAPIAFSDDRVRLKRQGAKNAKGVCQWIRRHSSFEEGTPRREAATSTRSWRLGVFTLASTTSHHRRPGATVNAKGNWYGAPPRRCGGLASSSNVVSQKQQAHPERLVWGFDPRASADIRVHLR